MEDIKRESDEVDSQADTELVDFSMSRHHDFDENSHISISDESAVEISDSEHDDHTPSVVQNPDYMPSTTRSSPQNNNGYIGANSHETYFNSLNDWMFNMRSHFQQIASSLDRQFQSPLDINFMENSENLMVECKSAPIWKRVLAEFIDGFIIFQFKFYIVLLLQNFLNLNLKDYADFLENPAIFHTITSGIALMDLVSRFVNFVYEAYFIWKDGATPGKRIAGIKVYWVEVVVPNVETGRVRVYPCNEVELPKALLRSFLKSIGLFIFLYGFFISNFTRAGHDLVAKTLVVDESEPMRNRPYVANNQEN